MNTREDPTAGWSRLHGTDVSGNRLVVGWLRIVHACARPLDRVPPDALSAAGVVCAGVAVLAAAQGRWAIAGAVLVVLTGLLDGLDGAVALRTGRARPLGAVVDAVADRLTDVAFVGVFLVLGADPLWCAGLVLLTWLHEYARARAQGAGMAGPGAVTVAERPTRVIIAAVVALGAGVLPAGTPLTDWSWAVVGAVLWAVTGVVGAVQLAVALRRELVTPGR
ncbi:CDP-alcohol phosphatidyltransferase family protein [Actinokineospora bangkokensis]|uniref:CDP-alcohol phosphatidyltransferase n=1 Tax=Actinokineospora bangkokensis TaxID=1193682 RepID=A0A1Q9LNU1_9PSEU|nr:CDP-alcohol phosphatidyltransferase family protein [Actinokineospora bangkokensis]OLR93690.1 hypothetical protein BJP25_15635 [Actinokineospora bangkokensis]